MDVPGRTVCEAVAYVCDLDVATLNEATRLEDIAADSLVRVTVADFVEQRLDAAAGGWRIDDADLGRVATIGELADVVRRLLPSAAVPAAG